MITRLSVRKILNYDLLGATYHAKYGTATYMRINFENAIMLITSTSNNIFELALKFWDITINNIYKFPEIKWPNLQGYILVSSEATPISGNSEKIINMGKTFLVVQCRDPQSLFAICCLISRVFSELQHGNITATRFYALSLDNSNCAFSAKRRVPPDFQPSQNRLVILETGLRVLLITSFPPPRLKSKKANWASFTENVDKFPPKRNNYDRFVGAVFNTTKKYIPRCFWTEYLSGWNEMWCDELYE